MGFIYIIIVVLGITSVAYLAKLCAKKGVASFDFTFVMFAAASILGYFFASGNHVPRSSYSVELFIISGLAGIGGAMAVFVFNHAVRIGHFGFTNAIYRSSFMIPVVVSILLFGAKLNISTVAGIFAIMISIFLISWSNDAFAKERNNLLWFLLSLCAFALSGLPRIGQLLISHNHLNSFAYLFASYASGFILLLFIFVFRRLRIKTAALLYGILAALASYAGVYFTIESLKLLPASVVFPITLSAPIILGMIISFIYRERIRLTGWIGVAAGICGILILSFQTYAK